MTEHKSNEQWKKETAVRLWLSYYNRVLFEKGVITEQERSRMELKINNRKESLT